LTAPDDNVISYEDDGLGAFIIECRDLPYVSLQDSEFAWAFVPCPSELEPKILGYGMGCPGSGGFTPALPLGFGCPLNITPLLLALPGLPMGGSGPGDGTVTLTSALPPAAAGVTLSMQALAVDGGVAAGVRIPRFNSRVVPLVSITV